MQIYKNVAANTTAALTSYLQVKVSGYKNVYSSTPVTITLGQVYKAIQTGKYAKLISQIRQEKNKENRRKLKLQLPAFTASGLYSGKAQGQPITTTGLIQIDIDELNYQQLATTRQLLENDPYTSMLFTSPSGNGLKILVRIAYSASSFLTHFYALESWYNKQYKIQIDSKCKNINRLCFLSSDPNIFVKEAQTFTATETRRTAIPQVTSAIPEVCSSNSTEQLVREIESRAIDITQGYLNWIKIGYSLVSEFGVGGEGYFIRISRFHPSFDLHQTQRQYQQLAKGQAKKSIAALFAIAKTYGVYFTTPNKRYA